MQALGRLTLVTDLPQLFTSIRDKQQAEEAYIESRAFIAWLAERYRASRFRMALDEAAGGATLDDAFQSVYRKDLAALQQDWMDDLGK